MTNKKNWNLKIKNGFKMYNLRFNHLGLAGFSQHSVEFF